MTVIAYTITIEKIEGKDKQDLLSLYFFKALGLRGEYFNSITILVPK